MPTYSHRCPSCGPFDVIRPMAAADAPAECPACGTAARRTFGAPALRATPAGVRAAVEAGERSAETPDVVRTPPPTGRRPRVSTDPRHARLPRP